MRWFALSVALFVTPAGADTIITYSGTISPWLWNGFGYYQGTLVDNVGVFGGGSLTGDAFTSIWVVHNGTPVSAILEINDRGVDFLQPGYLSTIARQEDGYLYTNVTYSLTNPFNPAWNISLNTFIIGDVPGDLPEFSYAFNPATDNLSFPHQLGGAFRLENAGISGYLNVADVTVHHAPGPVVGAGLPGLVMLLLSLWLLRRPIRVRWRKCIFGLKAVFGHC